MRRFCCFIILLFLICSFLFTGTAYADETRYLYVAGVPIGINVKTEGVIIDGKSEVITDGGRVFPANDLDISAGDVLLNIDDVKISRINDIKKALDKSGETVNLTLKHGAQIRNFTLTPAIESLNKEKRLGLLIRENVSGIGTLTFVTENMRFAALGHAIFDNSVSFNDLQDGEIFKSSILSVQRGIRGTPGELRGIFISGENKFGTIDTNTPFGLYGNYIESVAGYKKMKVGTKDDVKLGKARILSTVSGDAPRFYDVEIVRAAAQNSEADKGMIVRVVDNTLIDATGGIVQGMSGSPIIQDNKIIGALTHVFINDPERGYGVYIDFMLGK